MFSGIVFQTIEKEGVRDGRHGRLCLPEPALDQKSLRISPSPIEDRKEKLPSNPIRGSKLPVLGSSGAVAAGTGTGAASATKIGTSGGGGGGGGGIDPVSCR